MVAWVLVPGFDDVWQFRQRGRPSTDISVAPLANTCILL